MNPIRLKTFECHTLQDWSQINPGSWICFRRCRWVVVIGANNQLHFPRVYPKKPSMPIVKVVKEKSADNSSPLWVLMLAFLVYAGDSNFTVAVTMPIEMERELRKTRNNGERRIKKKEYPCTLHAPSPVRFLFDSHWSFFLLICVAYG
jgi:hypothetical protein